MSKLNEMTQIEINKEPVELFKILKFEGLVGSGGEAKSAIADGQVKLNGVVETQKRKKIVAGNRIEFMAQEYEIVLEQASTAAAADISTDWHIDRISGPKDRL